MLKKFHRSKIGNDIEKYFLKEPLLNYILTLHLFESVAIVIPNEDISIIKKHATGNQVIVNSGHNRLNEITKTANNNTQENLFVVVVDGLQTERSNRVKERERECVCVCECV